MADRMLCRDEGVFTPINSLLRVGRSGGGCSFSNDMRCGQRRRRFVIARRALFPTKQSQIFHVPGVRLLHHTLWNSGMRSYLEKTSVFVYQRFEIASQKPLAMTYRPARPCEFGAARKAEESSGRGGHSLILSRGWPGIAPLCPYPSSFYRVKPNRARRRQRLRPCPAYRHR